MENLSHSQLTAVHLLNLSHSVPLNPLNKVYKKKFEDFTENKELEIPSSYFSFNTCKHCGGFLIPGLTVSIRVVFKPRKKIARNRGFRQRSLCYKCLRCKKSFAHVLNLLTGEHRKQKEDEGKEQKNLHVNRDKIDEVDKIEGKEEGKSKAKSKRKKQNSLSYMLSEKKKATEHEKKMQSSLNLMEFMNKN